MPTKTLISMVSGVTYEGRQSIIAKLTGDEAARLAPEPDNKFDANALAVHVATPSGIKHVGYVPRNLAKQIAPALDGEAVMVKIIAIVGDYEGSAGLGLRIRIEYPVAEPLPTETKNGNDFRNYLARKYPDNEQAPDDDFDDEENEDLNPWEDIEMWEYGDWGDQ